MGDEQVLEVTRKIGDDEKAREGVYNAFILGPQIRALLANIPRRRDRGRLHRGSALHRV